MPRTFGDPGRLSQDEARRYQDRYLALFEDAPYGIYRSSVDGRFLEVNPALVQMLGYDSADELLALDLAGDVYADPDERTRLIKRGQVLYGESGRWRTAETRWKRRDGTEVAVRLSGGPVRDAAGEVTAFQMMVEDITERRQLEERLRQSQKMEAVGQLTAGIAHDFNNLLTVVLSHIDLVADALPPDRTELLADLREVRDAAHRGAEMVRKLSAFGRSEPLRLRPVELGTIVRDTTRLLRRMLPASIALVSEPDDAEFPLLGDPGAIEQVLLNLATNARDAMPEGGTLRIETERRRLTDEDRALHAWVEAGDYACLTVSDDGIGMDRQTQDHIFEPFFTTKKRGEGTGLGMAMVYGLVKQHAGYIHIYSEVGGGTTVRIYLPMVREQAPPEADGPEAAALPRGTETILLVEDDAKVITAGKRLLEKRGYRVLTAADGVRALEVFRAREREIDLVVTDMVMPRMGGRRLYDILRAEGSGVPVLFASGYTAGMMEGIDEGYGAVPFIHKPWTVLELVTKVREVLDGATPRSRRAG
jgi:two-component system NtrC family sensor kinase